MKSVVRDRYGSADAIEVREIDRPKPTNEQVLVRIRAASVNRAEWYSLTGRPYDWERATRPRRWS